MKISKVKPVKTPVRGTENSAGIDFFIPDGIHAHIPPQTSACIPSGIKVDVPEGYALIAFNKSGIALRHNLIVGACVVDEDYQGEIHLHVINVGDQDVLFEGGEKLIQFILLPVFYDKIEEVHLDNLYESLSERGEGGFGSTGT
ncbi:deoxyuridine 5'-triphosphate nucleotidohydrolase [bacterium]|nr:deoxyuridine 5'-triphosphate nucleotidohydrolase [bacterium]|tara:strand:+ start:701 stop:1132 length:432 start_codon:yes stop_codon:yes gene_type:complete